MFARLSRSSAATLRLFMKIIGCPKAFKYIRSPIKHPDQRRDPQPYIKENTLNACLQSRPNIHFLSWSWRTFPRIGSPLGPGGTLRNGLLVYRTNTTVAKRATKRPICQWFESSSNSGWLEWEPRLARGASPALIIAATCGRWDISKALYGSTDPSGVYVHAGVLVDCSAELI